MSPATKALAGGSVTVAVGLLLWLFTGDVHTPVITLTKVGVVLMFMGGLELLYGVYLGVVKKK
ncbi:DUF5708 family protein [Saccharothrix coeruleofusca]|nr:DUF5708 family protein [Saccharothrix coeruleofusca]